MNLGVITALNLIAHTDMQQLTPALRDSFDALFDAGILMLLLNFRGFSSSELRLRTDNLQTEHKSIKTIQNTFLSSFARKFL